MDLARFEAFILECQEKPWAWGTHDCLQFAAGAVRALSGIDFAERYGEYRSRLGAYRIIADFADLSAFITSILGEALPRNAARFGYVVTAYGEAGETAGVCLGGRSVFARAPKGIAHVDTARILHCWPIRCRTS